MTWISILLFLMFFSFFLFSIWPLLWGEIVNDKESHDLINALERRKSILYREIQYLDNEYYIENINAGDYNSSRTELVSEISEIIDQINLQSSKQGI
ncbi:MAG: hypothetical protein ACJZ1O_02170 [Candidatus Neomarinimicrobiota bacterium]|nr:MAG: hypothetical protein EVA23_04250 [bacterium]|tara:strand:- start:1397 stop:1687 length:291 start_codon:yes stop_codon:yes gene_type:complete